MKIIELRLKNLNSLHGEWRIDFTCPEYVERGIFVLTGPTGAGKSTILDAICLALYGRTPRIAKISSASNEVMSRGTSECYAEVIFESEAGSYLCRWEQKRSRGKVDGKLQDAKHEMAEVGSGKILESKLSRTRLVVEEKTGMDFERFTRSVLLAQGNFDGFLKAGEDEKAKILEQITGTEIYSSVSREIYERQVSEKQKWEFLRESAKELRVLSEEEECELREKLEVQGEVVERLEKEGELLQKQLRWREDLDRVMKEAEQCEREREILQVEQEGFSGQRAVLARAQQAARLDEEFAILEMRRRQRVEDGELAEKLRLELPKLEREVVEGERVMASVEAEWKREKNEVQGLREILVKVRGLEVSLGERSKQLGFFERDRAELEKEISREKLRQMEVRRELEEVERKLVESEGFLKLHARDARLVSEISGIEGKFAQLQAGVEHAEAQAQQYLRAKNEVGLALQARQVARDGEVAAGKLLVDFSEQVVAAQCALEEVLGGKTVRELRGEYEAVQREISLRKMIASLAEHRAALHDGEPCPLCGAEEHPYAVGNVPALDEKEQQAREIFEQIAAVEKAQERWDEKQRQILELRQAGERAQLKLEAAQRDVDAAENLLCERDELAVKAREKCGESEGELREILRFFGIEFSGQDRGDLQRELRGRERAWVSEMEKKLVLERERSFCISEERQAILLCEKWEADGVKKREQEKICRAEWEDFLRERRELFGEKDVEEEERALELRVQAVDAKVGEGRVQLEDRRGLQRVVREKWGDLCERLERLDVELVGLEKGFLQKRKKLGFVSEEEFLGSRYSEGERQLWEQRARELMDRQRVHAANFLRLEGIILEFRSEVLTTCEKVELEEKKRECDELLRQAAEDFGGLREKFQANEVVKGQVRERGEQLAGQEREYQRWANLNLLIGSADGKKFRTFVQGLTFERMVFYANGQLRKMSDRYCLERDEVLPLELNVIDAYQAGEVRSIKNLSGGECFLVSLALALGLSQMSSCKVRIDSLFLDEGFGTLDEDALDVALEALGSLHQEGKLIGMISHVAALKERISTQILVVPSSQGRSELRGPGCERLLK